MINSVRYSTTHGEVADNDNRKHPHAAARVARADRSDQAPQDHRRDQEGGIPFPPSRPWRSATNSSSSTVRTGPKPTSTAIDLRSEPASTTSPSARKYQAGATPYPAMQQRNWLTYSSPWTLSVRRKSSCTGCAVRWGPLHNDRATSFSPATGSRELPTRMESDLSARSSPTLRRSTPPP